MVIASSLGSSSPICLFPRTRIAIINTAYKITVRINDTSI
jgi:hypothetical protein